MPASLKPDHILDIAPERDQAGEISDEHFDRTAFARRALEIVSWPRTKRSFSNAISNKEYVDFYNEHDVIPPEPASTP